MSSENQLSSQEFVRLANNFYSSKGIAVDYTRISVDADLINYLAAKTQEVQTNKLKVAFCWICLNPPYWEFAKTMIEGAKKFFLPGHDVKYFLWSDMPEQINPEQLQGVVFPEAVSRAVESVSYVRNDKDTIVFPTEGVEWPLPTLMRYHLFLQQEEVLKDFDYIFYCDVDMMFVNVVGDEILGKGLTAALHPGYAIRKEYWPPYEPNKQSSSFINRPGMLIDDAGKPRFMPMYFAGGLQGGTSKEWFKAMRSMKELIDKDMARNYTPIWNDETAWNKYLENTPEDLVVLTPSYIYPDSLINEYYIPLWGCAYPPKLVTLTKKFSTSSEGGEAVRKMIQK